MIPIGLQKSTCFLFTIKNQFRRTTTPYPLPAMSMQFQTYMHQIQKQSHSCYNVQETLKALFKRNNKADLVFPPYFVN